MNPVAPPPLPCPRRRRAGRPLVALWLACAVALAAPRPTRAAPLSDEDVALALLRDGNRLMAEREYAAALGRFEDAYRHVPSPKLLLNIGTALLRLGRGAEAADAYEKYLGRASLTATRAAEARRVLADLEPHYAHVHLAVQAAGAVAVDGRALGAGPIEVTVHVAPGAHEATVSDRGTVLRRSFDARAGEELTLRFAASPPASHPALGARPAAPAPVAAIASRPARAAAVGSGSARAVAVAPGSARVAPAAPASPPVAAIASGSPGAATFAPGSARAATVAPGSAPDASVAPGSGAVAAVAPGSGRAATVAPGSARAATVAPGSAPDAIVAPGSGAVAAVAPEPGRVAHARAAPVDSPAAGHGKRAGGVALLVSGAVLAGAGVAFALLASAADDELHLGWDPATFDRFSLYRALEIGAFAAGGAAVITGAVLVASGVRESRAHAVVVAPVVGRGTVGASLQLRF